MESVIRERLLYACVMPVVVKGIKYVHSPIDGAETRERSLSWRITAL